MRISPKLLLLFLFTITITQVWSQKITLHKSNASLKDVIKDISRQTGYDFFYKAELLKKSVPVTISEDNKDVNEVLAQVFKNQPIGYTITNKTVILKEKQAITSDAKKNEGILSLAIGHVMDLAGSPLAGTRIKYTNQKGMPAEMYSDDRGGFQVPIAIGDKLKFYANGFAPKEILYNGEKDFEVSLIDSGAILPNVQVTNYTQFRKKDPTLSVDLTNRAYMNLSQVLQGTIPGLSLQLVNSSSKKITDIYAREGGTFKHYTAEQFLQAKGDDIGQKLMDAMLAGQTTGTYLGYNMDLFKFKSTTNIATTLVPQLRGANSFTNNLNGMLVVIDGFPKDEFPADYPMANVESVEVIKDPKELVKWGPKANGGIIMVKTKSPKSGSFSFNYNSNFYYTPAPKFDRNKMQRASSADVLDYLKQLIDSNLVTSDFTAGGLDLNAAQYLIYKKRNNLITDDAFNYSWDSLKRLDNSEQLNMLQQNSFNHNHSLSAFGSMKHYKFSAIGSYNSTESNALNNYNRKLGLNLINDLSLLNNKLKIQLYFNITGGHSQTGTTFDPNMDFAPYQMLLDDNGKYVYTYPSINQDVNTRLLNAGYFNYGTNLLEDARTTSVKTRQLQTQTRFNMNYSILEGLQWSSSVLYNTEKINTKNFSGKESSTVRQLVDSYGEYSSTGVNFYVPYGDMLSESHRMDKQLTVRSGFSYTKAIGIHKISASIGGGGYLYSSRTPSYGTMYGYNSTTKTGAPIYLPSANPQGAISNYTSLISGSSTSSYPSLLLIPTQGDSTNSRSLNLNASLRYSLNDKFSIGGTLSNAYNPNYGQVPTYSTLSTKGLSASYRVIEQSANNWFNKLDVSSSYSSTKMPDLPTSFSNLRYLQSNWNNYSIWVTGYSPSQQGGQKSEKWTQKITAQFFGGHVETNVAINRQKRSNMSNENSLGEVTNDSSATTNFMSAGAIVNLRDNLLRFNINYDKSPEGASQVNGDLSYDIARESYFHSNVISTLIADVRIENISPMQGLGLMMETNKAQAGGGYSLATNGTFNSMPPRNTNFEIHSKVGFRQDKYSVDLRYYNHSSSGLSSNVPLVSDPSTGLSSQYSYSLIKNKGVEFYLIGNLVKTKKFSYTLTINGAYNVNIAQQVPTTNYTMSSSYTTAYRNGYNTSSIWTYRWAGLDNQGNPQIYDKNNNIVSNPDSSTLASSIVYSGVTRAPWTGGLIQEFNYGNLFARVALNFNLGYVMRRYIPALSNSINVDNSVRINERWRKPGDEKYTDVAAISTSGGSSTVRNFIIKNSSNSIISADNIRLQEIMVGWNAPKNFLHNNVFKTFVVTFQVQNAALWTKNKWKIDPAVVSSSGEVGMSVPVIYSGSINLSF